jgi:hypothetical protein
MQQRVYKWIFKGAVTLINLRFIFFLLMLIVVNPAWSWGSLGHRAICDAAWRGSSVATQKLLTSAAKRMGYSTFAGGCVWADHIRGQKKYDGIKRLHYMNVPKNSLILATDPCDDLYSKKPSCVFSAITFYAQRWVDSQLSRRERDEALLLMAHFIGDIHQPLHVGFADDRGGTRKKITFNGHTLSLHRFWDTEILSCVNKKSWSQLGLQLFHSHGHYDTSNKISPAHQKTPGSNLLTLEPRLWAQESYNLTRKIYRLLTTKHSKYYCSMFYSAALQRLELASVRLTESLRVD